MRNEGDIVPGRQVRGRCVSLFAETQPYPETKAVAELTLDLGGISGTRHHGFTRKAGAREPWYPRGMDMRSGRQLTLVSEEELAQIAQAMNVAAIASEWIGANVLTRGIARLSRLPAGSRLVFADAVLFVEAQNAPCRVSGKSIARNLQSAPQDGIDLAFPKAAGGLRGVVATVEKAGTIRAGEDIVAKIPAQWIWRED
ncbi:MAG: MOSC domain-containing protein [Pseudorhodoplanes sp.]|nr:MOSC domain-containing protein [Pseudorhodoplanes sp.]